MSPESLALLRQILANQTLQVGQDDFLALATTAAKALQELDAALTEPERPTDA